ncbi:hypothetical protein KG089_03110 [Carnobacteriaceae bacterium zg-ZUI252]|nr:hypothetical protein [Carnobacteriaceae bacterium zg-ZUI252]
MEKKTSESQIKASRNWKKNNRERANYLANRRSARNFIKNKATQEDLNELKVLIQEREEQLKYME